MHGIYYIFSNPDFQILVCG